MRAFSPSSTASSPPRRRLPTRCARAWGGLRRGPGSRALWRPRQTRAYAAALLGPLSAHPRAHEHLRPSSLRGCAREAMRLLALYQQYEGVVPSSLGHFVPTDLPNLHAALSALLHAACASRAGLAQRGDARAFCQRELPGLTARLLAESEFALNAHGRLAARAHADGDEELARAAASVAHAARTAQRLALHTLLDLAPWPVHRPSHALPEVAPALLLAAAAPEAGVAAQARAALQRYAAGYAAAGMPGLYKAGSEQGTLPERSGSANPPARDGWIPASWLRAVGWNPNAQLGTVHNPREQARQARLLVRDGPSAVAGPEAPPQPLSPGPRASTIAALVVARTATWQDAALAWMVRSPRSSAAFAPDPGSVARGAVEAGVASAVGAAGYATTLLLAGDTRSLTIRKAAVAGAGGGLLVAVHYAMLWAQARATHADADSIALHHRLWVGTQGVVAALLVARVRRPLRGVGRLGGAVLALLATDLLCPDSADVER